MNKKMQHECTTKPNESEIVYDDYISKWTMKVFQLTDITSSVTRVYGITHCPYCGEELVNEL